MISTYPADNPSMFPPFPVEMLSILDRNKITFQETAHVYSRDSFRVASVTQVIPFICAAPEERIEKASARGKKVHKVVEVWGNQSGFSDVAFPYDEEVHDRFNAFERFVHETGFIPARLVNGRAAFEVGVYHPVWHYAGRLDCLGYLTRLEHPTDLSLIDIKNVAKISHFTGPQTSAYTEALNRWLKGNHLPQIKHRYALQLRKDRSYRLESFRDKSDFAVFTSLLTLHNWGITKGFGGDLVQQLSVGKDVLDWAQTTQENIWQN
jgi:hypothetical protein